MDTVFVLLFLISLPAFLISLFYPKPFLALFKNKLTKGGVRIALGMIMIFFFIALGITSDYSKEDKKEEKVAGLQSEVEQLKEENEKLKKGEAEEAKDNLVESEAENEKEEETVKKSAEGEEAEQNEAGEKAEEEIEENQNEDNEMQETKEDNEKEEANQMQKVTKVIDGDTIKLENDEVVRYIGIDTPETVHPSKPVQCFGEEASKKNTELVEGKEVKLEKDVSDTDKYDRLLRYVHVGDTFVNDYLVRNGYAYSSSYPPDVKYQDQFAQAEEEARENKRGLWADGACEEETEEEEEKIEEETAPLPAPASTSSCDCSGNTKNCSDFSTHNEAQACYESCLSSVGTDVHRLDRDKDGEACESLP